MSLTPSQFVTSGEVELAIYTWGEAAPAPKSKKSAPRAKPVVLLVHGYPDAASVWKATAEKLAEHYFVAAYDVRGAGRSSAPDHTQAYDINHLMDDLAVVIDTVSPDRPVHLLCHDWGSIQCWEAVTTSRMPGRIASYTSISGPSLDHIAYWTLQRLRSGSPAKYGQLARQLAHSWYIGMFHLPALGPTAWKLGLDKLWPRLLENVEGIKDVEPSETQREDGRIGVNLYRANVVKRLLHPQERRSDLPVQLIVPKRDKFMVQEIWDDLPQWVPKLWRREVNAGHWVQVSHPQLIAEYARTFIDFVESGVEPDVLKRSRVRANVEKRKHSGKLVVVTGAGSGFGRETALLFAQQGADIVAADLNLEAAEETAELVRLQGAMAWARKVDVGNAEQMEGFANWVGQDLGAADIIVNNAGIGMAGSFFETSNADWDKILRVNLWGVILGSRLFGQQMIAAGKRGHIVNVASMGGFTPSKFMSAYNTSKAAVMMLSDCIRAEVADKQISVSTICPGLSITNITRTTQFVGMTAEAQAQKQAKVTKIYQRRNLKPIAIARAIVDAVEHNRAEVPVGIEAHGSRLISRLLPPVARRFARLNLSP